MLDIEDDNRRSDLITVKSHGYSLTINPSLGGSVVKFCRDGDLEIFRSAIPDPSDVVDTSCFPMVPFCNRVRDGVWPWLGQDYALEPNTTDGKDVAHGFGWRSSWKVDRVTPTGAVLSHSRKSQDWPWDYEARQVFKLHAGGLRIVLNVTNRSEVQMPAGLGLHPYFPLSRGTSLKVEANRCAMVAKGGWPAENPFEQYELAQASAGRFDPLLGSRYWADVVGDAVIHNAEARRSVRMSFSGNVCSIALHVDRKAAAFCVEPMTHIMGAPNRPELLGQKGGLSILPPGKSLRLVVCFSVEPVSSTVQGGQIT